LIDVSEKAEVTPRFGFCLFSLSQVAILSIVFALNGCQINIAIWLFLYTKIIKLFFYKTVSTKVEREPLRSAEC
jgi:hypothetical protein